MHIITIKTNKQTNKQKNTIYTITKYTILPDNGEEQFESIYNNVLCIKVQTNIESFNQGQTLENSNW